MFSRSRFFLLIILVLLVFPITVVFAQSGGTEGDPPPIVETNPEVQDFHVYLPMLSKVVLTTDVAIADVQLSPNPIAIGETVHLTFSITNLGLTPSVEFPVDWKVLPLGETEPLASGSFVVPPLSYGQIMVLEADYQALIAGPFDVQVVADPFFENPDPIPANNSRSVELGVTGIVEFCGTITKDTVWAYATYVLGCNVELPEGISLLVRSGAVIKPTQQSIFINVLGNMELRGTETTPVVITSINDEEYGADANGEPTIPPSAGEWNKVFIGSTGVVNASHALLRYGLMPFWSDQGYLIVSDSVMEYFFSGTQINNGFINFQDNIIRNSNNRGLLYYNNGPFLAEPTLINNHFENNTGYAVVFSSYYEYTLDTSQVYGNTASNNGFNGIQLGGTLGGSSILSNAGIPYVLDLSQEGWESIYIPAGGELSIQPGTIIKLNPGNYDYAMGTGIEVAGSLLAQGTESEPIVFTSIKDDSYGGDTNNDGNATVPAVGDWTRHFVHEGAAATFEHVIIQYGGGQLSGQSLESIRCDAGELHLLNSSVIYGGGAGVRAINGILDIQDSNISNNTEHGIDYTISTEAAPIIKDSTFNNNSAYAIFLNFNEITLDASQVYGNIASGNGVNGIPLTGTMLGNSIIGEGGIPYILEVDNDHFRSIYVPTGSNLTINAGAIFKILGNAYWYDKGSGIEVFGTLNALGTAEAPIIFTSLYDDSVGGDTNNDGSSTTPAKADWTSHVIQSGGSATFDHVTISYAGGGIYGRTSESILNAGGLLHFHNGLIDQGAMTGIRSVNNGTLDVTSSTIRFQNEHGIVYSASGSIAPIIQDNTFDSNTSFAVYFNPSGPITLDGTHMSGNTAVNNGTNALRLIGEFTGSSTLQNPGSAIYLDYNPDHTLSLYVSAGSDLTIQPGTIFKGYGSSYDYGRGSGIEVYGTLNSTGTEENPIVFTSVHDDEYGGDTNNNGSSTSPAHGQWSFNYIGAGAVATFDKNLMRYAGGSIYGVPLSTIRNNGGTLNLSNSTVENGAGSGVRSESNGLINIQGNAFNGNLEHGIYYAASGVVAPVIQNNTFDSNGSFAVYFNPSGPITLDGTQMSGNNAINNGTNALRLIGTLEGTSTLQNPGFAIYLDYNPDFTLSINVSAGNVLTIQPGTILKGYGSSYWEGRGSGIQVSGILNALGTSEDPIIFTSLHDDDYGGDTNNNGSATIPAAGQWSFNYIGAGGVATFEHTLLRYGGGMLYGLPQTTIQNMAGTLHLSDSTLEYGSGSGVRSDASGVIDIHDNLIKSNTEYGIYYSASGSLAPIIQNNTFDSNASYAVYFAPSGSLTLDGTQMSGNNAVNNAFNALRLIGNFVGSSTLQNPGFAIMLHYNPDHMLSLYVPVGSSLTIQPGTILKGYGSSYWEGRGSGIEVYGTLNVAGTSEDPVVFTSLQDDAYGGDTNNDGSATVPASGQWSFNYIGASGTATFEHTLLRYAGAPIYGMPQPAVFNSGGSVSLTSSVVEHSANYGILQNGGELSLTAGQVSNNVIGVSVAAESGSTSFVDCDFLTNQIGIDFGGNSSTTTQNCIFEGNAQYGYRNQTSLTLDVTNNWWGDASGPSPYGTGDSISGNLTVSPWLTVKPR